LHPTTGEQLGERAVATLGQLRQKQAGQFNVQIVISDGLNALAIMQDDQLLPFLNRLRSGLEDEGLRIAPDNLVITFGRVRAGYHVGEILFAGLAGPHAILHIIGERPGTGHRTYSIYITAPDGNLWASKGSVDHNITKVVSGVATTALEPTKAAEQVLRLLRTII
jgi:ethanolamine ammonia-lyase large subunit